MNVPDNLLYAETHEWLRVEDGIGTVGITDHAQAELSDVVFVELPKVGAKLDARGNAAVVESVKAASDIYSPAAGEVTEVNAALESSPELLNSDPFGEGWIFRIRLDGPAEGLKSAAEYRTQIGA